MSTTDGLKGSPTEDLKEMVSNNDNEENVDLMGLVLSDLCYDLHGAGLNQEVATEEGIMDIASANLKSTTPLATLLIDTTRLHLLSILIFNVRQQEGQVV